MASISIPAFRFLSSVLTLTLLGDGVRPESCGLKKTLSSQSCLWPVSDHRNREQSSIKMVPESGLLLWYPCPCCFADNSGNIWNLGTGKFITAQSLMGYSVGAWTVMLEQPRQWRPGWYSCKHSEQWRPGSGSL